MLQQPDSPPHCRPPLGISAKTEANLTGKLVEALGVSTIEEILLYHVAPGVKIIAKAAAEADGAKLDMANGQTVGVNVTNINKGNKQITHAINRVLLPALSA
ncbi:MAG: hypothetical protein LH630_09920 [Actinomycetia bacterium]|nr:hypothetical protein [Actinomycetes bacterium]